MSCYYAHRVRSPNALVKRDRVNLTAHETWIENEWGDLLNNMM